jgi:disease resistance protein RPM1
MADTVLSMARSMVGGALSKAASAAADEMSLLMGVRKDIWYVCMNFFVQVAHLP